MNRKIIFIIVILTFSILYFFPLDVPFLSGRVNDYAGILDNDSLTSLNKKLADYEKATTNQLVVLTIKSLEGENLEDFSMKTVEKWKLGVKGKDNGVMLFIALEDRKLRIEVGYGLEESLTDIKCSQIIRNKITPFFKSGNYKEGIISGVDSIISVIGGKDNLADETPVKESGKNSIDSQIDDMDLTTRILIGLFIFGILGLFTFIGIALPKGSGTWFLYPFLIPFWAIFPMMVVGTKITLYIAGIYIIGFPLAKILLNVGAKHSPGIKKFQKIFAGSGKGHGSGYSSSSGFGSSSGFSSSSSDFSGGGGSFGGGGSSGSW
jgi:uncharacterized protein